LVFCKKVGFPGSVKESVDQVLKGVFERADGMDTHGGERAILMGLVVRLLNVKESLDFINFRAGEKIFVVLFEGLID
jgi:hypothetical protein